MRRARTLAVAASAASLPWLASMAPLASACRSAPPHSAREPQVVVVPATASSTALRTTNAPPEPPRGRAFELVAGWQLCAIVDDVLHCRSGVQPDKPLGLAPPALAGVAVASASFGRDFGCVATRTGAVECFGGNHFGQLGASVREESHLAPLVLPKLAGARRVVSGPSHACAILAGGRVACWGKNQFGENGSSTQYLEAARELVEPEVVPGVEGATELALAWDATCAVARGEMWCWGRSKTDEQRARRGDSNEAAARDPSLYGITSIVANENAFCGVRDGAVVCWGNTHMLDAARGPRQSVLRLPVPGAARVCLGANHGCAVTSSGAVYCFGSGSSGELGVAAQEGDYLAHAPTKLEGIADATDVVCGWSFSCAVTSPRGGASRDDVWCWGRFGWQNDEHAMSASPVNVRIVD